MVGGGGKKIGTRPFTHHQPLYSIPYTTCLAIQLIANKKTRIHY